MKIFKVIPHGREDIVCVAADKETELDIFFYNQHSPIHHSPKVVETLEAGDSVFWDDPDEGQSSGEYQVVKIVSDQILLLRSDYLSEIEVQASEVKCIKKEA